MKVKQYVVITNPNQFLESDYTDGMSLFGSPDYLPKKWIICGEIEIDLDVDVNDITKTVIGHMDAAISEKTAIFNAEIRALNARKQELMALPAPHMSEYDAKHEYNSDDSIEEDERRENAILDRAEWDACGGKI